MPVYNGERYIAEALQSLSEQSYADFELLISDNASGDDTEAICREYAAADSRIRYLRQVTNQGASRNFNTVFAQSAGDYFKWAAHDDVLAPEFLARCVEALDSDPSICLCYTRERVIDASGVAVEVRPPSPPGISSNSPQVRFAHTVLKDRDCTDVFGLMRRSVVEKTALIASHIASDRSFRAEMALLGRFHQVPEVLFYSRDHPERSIRAMPAHHLRGAWFDPRRGTRRVYPHWRILLEYFRCIRRRALAGSARAACYACLLRWLGLDGNWARLGADVIVAASPGVWQSFHRVAYRFTRRRQSQSQQE